MNFTIGKKYEAFRVNPYLEKIGKTDRRVYYQHAIPQNNYEENEIFVFTRAILGQLYLEDKISRLEWEYCMRGKKKEHGGRK